MGSVKRSVQGWNKAARRLAVVIVLVAQSLGLEAVWTQELPQPRLDEEFTKQEKSTAAGAPMFPAATSPAEGSRTMRNFFPPASATRSAGSAARTAGWISARARGQGVPQDYQEAVKWYRLAAAQGNQPAQINLGVLYTNGTGVRQDLVRAHLWFTLAAAASSGDSGDAATKNRDRIASKMTTDQIATAQEMARRCQESKLKNCD